MPKYSSPSICLSLVFWKRQGWEKTELIRTQKPFERRDILIEKVIDIRAWLFTFVKKADKVYYTTTLCPASTQRPYTCHAPYSHQSSHLRSIAKSIQCGRGLEVGTYWLKNNWKINNFRQLIAVSTLLRPRFRLRLSLSPRLFCAPQTAPDLRLVPWHSTTVQLALVT